MSESPERFRLVVEVDALSLVLDSLELEGRLFCRSELQAPWRLAFPSGDHAHFHFVEQGACRLETGTDGRIVELAQGDLAIVPRGGGHDMADGEVPAESRIDVRALPGTHGGIGGCRVVRHGGTGRPTRLVCGSFRLRESQGHPLLALLPELMVVRASHATEGAPVRALLALLVEEALGQGPGSSLLTTRLVDMLFVHVLRHWLERQPEAQPNWLGALRDPRLGRALAALHARPELPWTVAGLAQQAGMSRSPFAAQFTRLVGEPPLGYLARWRLRLAARLLRRENLSLAETAARVGYESEAAFAKAFKRFMGEPPGSWRRRQAA
jgi:AraC-like DNA-binding protein